MHKQIHSGIEELGNSVRRFSEQHLKETRPGHDSNPDEIIEKACSILHDKNKNTLEVPSIKRKGLRSAGKGTTLSEYHKNLKAFLAKQKSEPEDTGSPKTVKLKHLWHQKNRHKRINREINNKFSKFHPKPLMYGNSTGNSCFIGTSEDIASRSWRIFNLT